MKNEWRGGFEGDLPAGLPKPARRALVGAGYERLDRLSGATEGEVLKLHGMGPKAMGQLREALAARGRAFAQEAGQTARYGDHKRGPRA